jgi:hypothetical protein
VKYITLIFFIYSCSSIYESKFRGIDQEVKSAYEFHALNEKFIKFHLEDYNKTYKKNLSYEDLRKDLNEMTGLVQKRNYRIHFSLKDLQCL